MRFSATDKFWSTRSASELSTTFWFRNALRRRWRRRHVLLLERSATLARALRIFKARCQCKHHRSQARRLSRISCQRSRQCPVHTHDHPRPLQWQWHFATARTQKSRDKYHQQAHLEQVALKQARSHQSPMAAHHQLRNRITSTSEVQSLWRAIQVQRVTAVCVPPSHLAATGVRTLLEPTSA